jgi:sarcosine reductase
MMKRKKMKRKIILLILNVAVLACAVVAGPAISAVKLDGGMRLEVGNINIKDVQLAGKTEIKKGVLYVNAAELKALLLTDKRLERVDIDVANPGDSTRIVRALDAYEPIARTGNRRGEFPFPGVLGEGVGTGPIGTGTGAGNGSINKLKGAAVLVCTAGAPPENKRPPTASGKIIQMSGGGEVSDFAKTHNVVIVTYPAEGSSANDFTVALRLAGLRAAAYLGKAGEDLKPDNVEVYQLPPLTEMTKGMEKLPKVAYVFMIEFGNTRPVRGWGVNVGEPVLYGGDADVLMPMIMHPNEVLDGAVAQQAGGRETTYAFQNNPVIKELYRRHGQDLYFTGIVLVKDFPGPMERQTALAMITRQLVGIMGVDGVVITKYGGGAPQNFTAQIAAGAARYGVKSAISPWGGCYAIFTQPEANQVISTGYRELQVNLAAVNKVIGFHYAVTPSLDKLSTTLGDSLDTSNQLGGQRNKCVETPGDIWHMLPQRNVVMEKTGAERLVQMVLDQLAGKPIETEIRLDVYPPTTPPPAIKDVSKAKIALISSTGLINKKSPMFPGNDCDRFVTWNIKGMSTFPAKDWTVSHGGYQEYWVREDPNRLYALPELRQMEREGKIGEISDTMFFFSGLANRWGNMRNIGRDILPMLKTEKIDAVLLVST